MARSSSCLFLSSILSPLPKASRAEARKWEEEWEAQNEELLLAKTELETANAASAPKHSSKGTQQPPPRTKY